MPRLLMFAPCEKVITATEDNGASLISILQGFDVPVAPPKDSKAIAPITWYAFSLWEAIEEEPERFAQRVQLLAPKDSEVLFTVEMPIVTPNNADKRFHRHAIKNQGFPIPRDGD